jgi:alpha-galactosidase
MVVSDDRRRAVVGVFQVLNRPMRRADRLRLRGLDEALTYGVGLWPPNGRSPIGDPPARGGDELMTAGLVLDSDRRGGSEPGDFFARVVTLEADA